MASTDSAYNVWQQIFDFKDNFYELILVKEVRVLLAREVKI